MRSITVCAVLVIMLGCAPCAAAQEESPLNSYTLSSWTSLGMFFGQAEEIVYPPPGFKAKMLSQLLWDIKPVFYDSFSLDFSQAQPMEKWGLFVTLSLKIGFPGMSGAMEDRDWESKEHDALTKYSVHDNITRELIIFDAFAGVSLPLNAMLLKAYVAMSYMRFSFTGQYGHGTYSLDDDPYDVSFAGIEKAINYTQTWITIAPGISMGSYFDRFYFEFFFAISPLVSCRGVDEHLLTNTVFKDFMYGGVFIEPGCHFSFIASTQLEFSLDLSWRYIGGTRGATWSGSPISTTALKQEGEAGARLSLFNIGLCMKIRP